MAAVLVIDDQTGRRDMLMQCIRDKGHRTRGAAVFEVAPALERKKPDMVIINLPPDDLHSFNQFTTFKKKYPGLPVLLFLRNDLKIKKMLKLISLILPCAYSPVKTNKTQVLYIDRKRQETAPA